MNSDVLMTKSRLEDHMQSHIDLSNILIAGIASSVYDMCEKLRECLLSDGTIFVAGNGGSASQSQHLVAELVGRFINDRRPLKAVCLNADTAVMTCIVNDFGADQMFARQLDAVGSQKDIFIGFSTSGLSNNLNEAFKLAKRKQIYSCAILGKQGGVAKDLSDTSIIIPSCSTALIQEMHLVICHLLCLGLESSLGLND